jgi:hypothetical protein
MKRCITLGSVLLISIAVTGCSGGASLDRAELRQQQTAKAETAPRRVARTTVPRREPRQAERVQRPRIAGPVEAVYAREVETEPGEITGAISRNPPSHRPMPFTGTPEWHQLQADEIERERRIQRAMQNICRGC